MSDANKIDASQAVDLDQRKVQAAAAEVAERKRQQEQAEANVRRWAKAMRKTFKGITSHSYRVAYLNRYFAEND